MQFDMIHRRTMSALSYYQISRHNLFGSLVNTYPTPVRLLYSYLVVTAVRLDAFKRGERGRWVGRHQERSTF